MATSNIEWTDDTWNPTVGCTKVSAGCKHCYAETMHARLTAMGQPKYAEPFTVVKPYPAHLDVPLRAGRPRRYFVNSMSDLFHEDVPDDYIAAVFGVMAACPRHTFQVLTKRVERLARWFEWAGRLTLDDMQHFAHSYLAADAYAARGYAWPLPNVWIGVSVENQEQADARIPHLVRVRAAVRFLSCEPLLGPVDLSAHLPLALAPGNVWRDCMCEEIDPSDRPCVVCAARSGVDWVIVGGESGRGARPFDLAWARSLIAQCRAAGVPVFMKQIGKVVIGFDGNQYERDDKGGDPEKWAEELRVREWPMVQQ